MSNDLDLSVKNLARSMSVLVVDDDELTLEIYKSIFGELFLKVHTAKDGNEAYEIWNDHTKKIDLIITDIMMPNLDGFGLINKIRKDSSTQHILVVTSLDDLNEMRDIINLGVDGIILKPFNQEKVLPLLARVLEVIKAKKILKRQVFQLKLLSQDKIALKASAKQANTQETKISMSKANKPILEEKKQKSSLSSKYKIRTTLVGSDANELDNIVDYNDTENIDSLLHSIHEYESFIIDLESQPIEDTIQHLVSSTQPIAQLVKLMNNIGSFSVAVDAGENLINFIQTMPSDKLQDADKKELFFDAYLSMFQDIEKWLNVVFIDKEASNINYFDASFANTCLELETIFADVDMVEDDSELEFF